MGRTWIKLAAGKLEGQRASEGHLQRIGQDELHRHQGPDGQIRAEHHHAAHLVDGCKDTAFSRPLHEIRTMQDIQAVKHIGMNSDDDRQQGIDGFLKLGLRHVSFSSSFDFAHKKTHAVQVHLSRRKPRAVIRFTYPWYNMCRASVLFGCRGIMPQNQPSCQGEITAPPDP